MARFQGLVPLVVPLVSGGCNALLDPEPMDPPVLSAEVLCPRQDSLMQAAGRSPTVDAQFAVLAQLLPGGFGGLHEGGMYLVYPYRGDKARQVAGTLERCAGRQAGYLNAVRQSTVLQGDFDWLQLSTWRSRIDADPGLRFVFTDTNEATNRVVVGVSSEADRRRVLDRLSPLRIPNRAVYVIVVPHPPPG